jgi:hypothetical protein
VAGADIADKDEEGFSTFIGSIPVVLPEAIVKGEQVTPGGKLAAAGQVTTTAPVNPPLGVRVIVEFDVVIVPAAPPAVVTVVLVAVSVKLPPLPIVPVKEKFRILLPPKAMGLGSKAPNELTIM